MVGWKIDNASSCCHNECFTRYSIPAAIDVMLISNRVAREEFVNRCAQDELSGRLTTLHLRRELEDSQVRELASKQNF